MKLSLSTTDLPVPADVFAPERDSCAFRTFLAKVRALAVLERCPHH